MKVKSLLDASANQSSENFTSACLPSVEISTPAGIKNFEIIDVKYI